MTDSITRSEDDLAGLRDRLERLMFREDDVGFASLLDSESFPVNHKGRRGDTLLHTLSMISVNSKTLILADHLISRGAEMDVRTDDGHTPLSNAVMTGGVALCMLLLHRGADVDAPSGGGSPALHHAFPTGFGTAQKLTRLLLRAGADTAKFARMTGELALNEAVLRGGYGVVMELMAAGEDPRAVSPKTGLTALKLAEVVRSPNDGSLLREMQSMLDARLASEAIDDVIRRTRPAA